MGAPPAPQKDKEQKKGGCASLFTLESIEKAFMLSDIRSVPCGKIIFIFIKRIVAFVQRRLDLFVFQTVQKRRAFLRNAGKRMSTQGRQRRRADVRRPDRADFHKSRYKHIPEPAGGIIKNCEKPPLFTSVSSFWVI